MLVIAHNNHRPGLVHKIKLHVSLPVDLIELINSMPSLTYLDCSAAWRDEDNFIPLQFFIDRLKKKGQQLELVLGGKLLFHHRGRYESLKLSDPRFICVCEGRERFFHLIELNIIKVELTYFDFLIHTCF